MKIDQFPRAQHDLSFFPQPIVKKPTKPPDAGFTVIERKADSHIRQDGPSKRLVFLFDK